MARASTTRNWNYPTLVTVPLSPTTPFFTPGVCVASLQNHHASTSPILVAEESFDIPFLYTRGLVTCEAALFFVLY